MENKLTIAILTIALLCVMFFLGAAITGNVVKTVEYEDICATNEDCPSNQCCVIYTEEGIGLCRDECQSVEFLCTSDTDCELGNVCCMSKGMKYGICNSADKCRSVSIFGEYAVKKSRTEKPAAVNNTIISETVVIIVLLAIIIWLLVKQKKRK